MTHEQDTGAEPLALLLLEDGHFFTGRSFGFANHIAIANEQLQATEIQRLCGELCFNTGMSGYQEVLSDPSYAGQMICFSFPHIGNVGANAEDSECRQPHALAMISRDYPTQPSNWRSEVLLTDWLERHRISGICGLDTRALIHHLRQNGSMRALLGAIDPEMLQGTALKAEYYQLLLAHLLASPRMTGQNLGSQVSRRQPEVYDTDLRQRWFLLETHPDYAAASAASSSAEIKTPGRELHVAVLDSGIKDNILQCLKRFAAKVTVLPLQSSWQDVADLRPDGLFLPNGPGDPQPVYQQLAGVLEQAFQRALPIFGICLGHQILALSLGARTVHMHHGHRGVNHPVLNIERSTVEITSQNHGFCVEESTLSAGLTVTHRSLFDSSIEGIRSHNYPAFSVQYHPESSPGPHDSMYLFRDFIELMEKQPNVFSK